MSEDIIAGTNRDWFDNHLRSWAENGWHVEDIETYLQENSMTATEALMRVEYLVGASERLIVRMSYEWLERYDISNGLFTQWIDELNNPMNYEEISQQYNEWARQNRRWELVLESSRRDWETMMLAEERVLILARCDSLDQSSKPRLNLLISSMNNPQSYQNIDASLSEIEENEARQKRAVYSSIEALQSDGYDVEHIAEMNLVDALKEVSHRQKLHNLHEIIRLQIIDEIAEYDDNLAENYELQRKAILNSASEIELNDLSKQVSAIGLDLKQRLSKINRQIADWEDSEIIFSTSRIEPKDLFEWETNLPELTTEVENHIALVKRYRYFSERIPNIDSAQHYIGYLNQSTSLSELVEDLELRWKAAELECYSIIERYQNLGLAMDDWEERVTADPIVCLDLIKAEERNWQNRIQCIEELLAIDVSFDGKLEVEKRIDLLREVDAGDEIIEDTKLMINRLVTRRARHRVLLERELMELIAIGKASENTASSTFNLAAFEDFVANARIGGSSSNSSITGNAVISGDIGERIKQKISHEITLLESAGWYTKHLQELFEAEPMKVARMLTKVRTYIQNHDVLRRRLSNLPWNRNTSLALEIQEAMQDPLQLAKITEQIPDIMKALATSEIEDENFVFSPWTPKPIRKTLMPVPEQVMQPIDSLGDAHEAILESMESGKQIREDEIVRADGLTDYEFWEDEKWSSERWRGWRERQAELSAKREEKEQKSHAKPTAEDVELEPPQQKTTKTIHVSESVEIQHLHIIMNKLGLEDEYNQNVDSPKQISEIRRCLAKNVGVEPRDVRLDRLLRLILRLLPQGNEHDEQRKLLIMKLASGLKRYQNWIKLRLEARHKASKGSLILDSAILGIALKRIPGPGFKVPLDKDVKELPPFDNIEELAEEVSILLNALNLKSASGVVVSAQ